MTRTDEILSRLNPKTAASFRKASETKNELLATPSLGMNLAISGVGYGRQTTIWGNRSGGKTAMCLQMAGQAQRDDKGVAWIDAEKNFDKKWAGRLGVDADQLMISKITSIADMADAGYDLLKSGVDVLVVDSISTLLPQSFFEEGEMKGLSKTGQIGTYSKNLGAAMNMFNNINDNTAIIFISQMRNKFSTYGASLSPMGGLALDHMNSTLIKLWSNPNLKEAIEGTISEGDLIFKRPIGRPVTWTIEKNRGPGMNMMGSYDFYFAGDYVGVDRVGEIIDLGVEYGEVKKGGAWYTIGEERFQGRPKAVAYLRENPEVEEEIYHRILKKANR